jgi:hypothetical protein
VAPTDAPVAIASGYISIATPYLETETIYQATDADALAMMHRYGTWCGAAVAR